MAILYENDINYSLILDRTAAVPGFGAQGRAHALNLHDSGVNVCVGLREDSDSAAACLQAGVDSQTLPQAVSGADVVMMLILAETGCRPPGVRGLIRA